MTKSQIIRELTIELAAKCKVARGMKRDLNSALDRNVELKTELINVKFQIATLEANKRQAEAKYEGESAERERVLEHVRELEAEIERMREDTMALVVDEYGPLCTLDRFKKALGIIK